MTIKQRARLENWSIIGTLPSPYAAPEQAVFRLRGQVYGHPDSNLRDGEVVVTSSFVDMDIKERWVQTRNTLYTLGKPDPDYVKYIKDNFPEQFYKYDLADLHPKVVTVDIGAVEERVLAAEFCDSCNAPQLVTPDGEHHCGETPCAECHQVGFHKMSCDAPWRAREIDDGCEHTPGTVYDPEVRAQ